MSDNDLEQRARELHRAIRPGSCGFQYQERCIVCRELIIPLLTQVRLEEAKWWADHDIEDLDTQDQWDEIAKERIAALAPAVHPTQAGAQEIECCPTCAGTDRSHFGFVMRTYDQRCTNKWHTAVPLGMKEE